MSRAQRVFGIASIVVAAGLTWGAASASGADAPGRSSAPAPASGVWERAAIGSAEGEPAQGFVSPVQPLVVTAPARIPDQPWQPGHRGIDVASHVDAPVRTPADGVVTFAGTVVDRAVVSVRHANGLTSSVEPVRATVTVGDHVPRGAEIGRVTAERGHCAPATCVHWGVRRDDTYIDPLDVLEGYGPVRLLEVG